MLLELRPWAVHLETVTSWLNFAIENFHPVIWAVT